MDRVIDKESSGNDTREHILRIGQEIMGLKGFSGVGLSELLAAAKVPKGSFYHYFASKEVFGQALLERHFENYLVKLDAGLKDEDRTGAEILLEYFTNWNVGQAPYHPQSTCIVVKLAAEVSDLSEPMRQVLLKGTSSVIQRISLMIDRGVKDKSMTTDQDALKLAKNLYQLWLGASLLVKISRDDIPVKTAMEATRRVLGLRA